MTTTGRGSAFSQQRYAGAAAERSEPARRQPEQDPVRVMGEHLEVLLTYYREHLQHVPWVVEQDRWFELAFCLLYAADAEVNASKARETALLLRHLGLLDVESLAAGDRTDAALVLRVLTREGYSEASASAALRTLQGAAVRLAEDFHGDTGVLLEQLGGQLRDALIDVFGGGGLDRNALGYATTIWLQNTANLPLPSLDPAVERLCERCGTEYDAFLQAVAEQGINVPVAEELVRMAETDEGFQRWLSDQVASEEQANGGAA